VRTAHSRNLSHRRLDMVNAVENLAINGILPASSSCRAMLRTAFHSRGQHSRLPGHPQQTAASSNSCEIPFSGSHQSQIKQLCMQLASVFCKPCCCLQPTNSPIPPNHLPCCRCRPHSQQQAAAELQHNVNSNDAAADAAAAQQHSQASSKQQACSGGSRAGSSSASSCGCSVDGAGC
jgi:hypothetical protein